MDFSTKIPYILSTIRNLPHFWQKRVPFYRGSEFYGCNLRNNEVYKRYSPRGQPWRQGLRLCDIQQSPGYYELSERTAPVPGGETRRQEPCLLLRTVREDSSGAGG